MLKLEQKRHLTKKPKKKPMKRAGKRISAWILPRNLNMWDQLDNKSEFLQLCLDNAIDIMTVALMRNQNPRMWDIHRSLAEQKDIIQMYNKTHPANDLTKLREDYHKWQKL